VVILPGGILVVDESLYEFNGECPVKRYIPRKPHPNGILVYCLAGYLYVGEYELPYVFDIEPYVLDNLVSAQEAMMCLYNRFLERHPLLHPHLVVDSAFGSFDKIEDIVNSGGGATMSMPANAKSWLWELLDFNCGIDEGRLAFLPTSKIVVSSFKVLTEAGNEHQIKTISSGCSLDEAGDEEEIVSKVIARRVVRDNTEYHTEFMDGHREWLGARQFIDDDGTTNFSWLHFADADDLGAAFESFTHNQLREMCTAQGWKPTGDKQRVLKRVVKKAKQQLAGKEGVTSLIESKIGSPTKVDGSSSQLRRFYTNNYPALDRFDRLWYEMRFFIRPRDWESHFCWSLLHTAVINARSVWCAVSDRRVSMVEFLSGLVSAFAASVENE
jgi:hypothetical protein